MTENEKEAAAQASKIEWAPARYRAFVRRAVRILLISITGLLAIDYWLADPKSGVLARLVASGFVAGVAANLLVALIVLVFIDRASRKIESDAKAADVARWARVREAVGNRVRSLATGEMGGLRASLGIHASMAFFKGLPADTAGMQIGATQRTATALRTQMADLVSSLRRDQWRELIEHLNGMRDRVRLALDRSQWLNPDQMRMLLDLEDRAQSILGLYVVIPELYARPDEIENQFADESYQESRALWYRSIIASLSEIVDTLERLVQSHSGNT